MPMQSKAQARKLFSLQEQGKLKPGTAVRWMHETPNFRRLPEHVKPRQSQRGKKSR